MIGKIPFKPKKGYVLPRHHFSGPFNPLQLQLDERDNPKPGNEPYNAVDATSMRHDICYRDNLSGKSECDRKMLAELKRLVPKSRREAVDRQLVRSIIGLKYKLGMGATWSSQLADELHKLVRRRFEKRHVFVKQIDDIWAADLVDMSSFSRSNKGYKFLLTVIDVYSKYGWTVPLKTKTGKEVASALVKLFKIAVPSRLWTDKGAEFYNQHVRRALEANNVTLYYTDNEEKSSAERWNRTMKRIMWKYFTANNANKYIDELQNMVDKFNTTYHRSIKHTPAEARDSSNYKHVFRALYGKIRPTPPPAKFHVGEKVRISRKKYTFEKGFTPNWTEEVFTVSEVKHTNPITYSVKDLIGEPVKGTFYEQELQATVQEIFRIERVFRRAGNRAYVKWKGHSNAFNSWVSVADLEA